ncbi:MAG TPA: family 1 glycosylhydrolase, partial [Terrimicrobiaceae bacterium]|nr:family 1 glycosylhydrolase [Terrimicrobiaceae bacterium]
MIIAQRLSLSLALGLCAALSGCVISPPPYKKPAAAKTVNTGPFWWGTSTASFQNEDRGVSPDSPYYFKTDWDIFSEEGHIPPRGDTATFSWSRFDKDVAALKKLGVNHYRFGIEWGRVEPKPGVFNEAAIRQYVTMAKKLKAAGIEPIVTLWHFTFPSWLYDTNKKGKSDFLHPDVESAWREYVGRMVTALAPYVRVYVPQNEPNGDLYIGYFGGHWPPGLLLTPVALKKATKVAVNMFRDAATIIRRERPDALIMGIYSIPNWRRNFLQDPTQFVYNMMMHQNWDHLDKVADMMDIVGVNYYYSQDASALRFIVRPQGELASNYTQNGWEIDPEGFYAVLKAVNKRYGKPIVVSENGIGTQSEQKKIRYFREHVNQMRRAMNDGVDVRGYFPWTLIDNYEWAEGYAANFGLTHVDPKTKELVIEPSG